MIRRFVLTAAMFAGTTTLAIPQPLPSGHPGGSGLAAPGGAAHGGAAATPADTAAKMNERIDSELASMKAKIGITESQTAAWNGFADTWRGGLKMMHNPGDTDDADGGSAPDHLQAMVQRMSAMLANMQSLLNSEQALYAVLTVEQRKTADELLDFGGGGQSAPHKHP